GVGTSIQRLAIQANPSTGTSHLRVPSASTANNGCCCNWRRTRSTSLCLRCLSWIRAATSSTSPVRAPSGICARQRYVCTDFPVPAHDSHPLRVVPCPWQAPHLTIGETHANQRCCCTRSREA